MALTTFAPETVIRSSEINANFLECQPRTFTTTATAATTTTLLVSSTYFQFFTGTTTQTVTMPVATTMTAGYGFEIVNLSTGVVTVQSSGANTIQAMAAGSKLVIICKLASGTGTASWEWTYVTNYATGANPMTTGGDIIYGGTAGLPTRLANGSAGQFLKSSGGTSAPVWASAIQGDVQSKTTTYSAVATDGYIKCSGSAFTVTLFAASGNSGKVLTITKTDSSLSNIITIDGNASETINGALTTTLNTQYESVTLYCDGSNWFVLHRVIPKTWTSYTATVTGDVTAGSITYTANTLYWAREGSNVRVHGNIRLNVVTTAPTGNVYINLPSGISWDAMADDSDAGRGAWGTTTGRIASAAQAINFLCIGAPNTSSICIAIGTGAFPALAATDEIKVNFSIPVSGWNQ